MHEHKKYDQWRYTTPPLLGETSSLYVEFIGLFENILDIKQKRKACFFVPHHFLSGEGIVIHKKKKYHVKAGDTFFFYPGEEIEYYPKKGTIWKYFWMKFTGDSLWEIVNKLGVSAQKPHLKGRLSNDMLNFVDDTIRQLNNPVSTLFVGESIAWKFFDLLSAGLYFCNNDNRQKTNLAWLCKTQMDNEFASQISIIEISKNLDVNHSTLYRNFKKTFGITPQQYLENIRLKSACELLLKSRLTIKEIAFKSGFNDANYFNRVFKLNYQSSPGVWRKDISRI